MEQKQQLPNNLLEIKEKITEDLTLVNKLYCLIHAEAVKINKELEGLKAIIKEKEAEIISLKQELELMKDPDVPVKE